MAKAKLSDSLERACGCFRKHLAVRSVWSPGEHLIKKGLHVYRASVRAEPPCVQGFHMCRVSVCAGPPCMQSLHVCRGGGAQANGVKVHRVVWAVCRLIVHLINVTVVLKKKTIIKTASLTLIFASKLGHSRLISTVNYIIA